MKTKSSIPPRLARKLLNWFLRDDLAEEVEGDLEEKFTSMVAHGSIARARLNFWFQVIHYIRPFAVRKSMSTPLNKYDMFSNYFKIAFRNLNRNKGYSFINIGGLAVGMAVAILIGLWIHDELTYDQYHQNYSRLAQVMQQQTFNGSRETGNALPRPLEMAIRSSYGADFEGISMTSWTGDHILSVGDVKISKTGNYFQEDFPEMITTKMLKGTRKGLGDPSSIMLSESTAKALFGDKEPINQIVRLDNRTDLKVIGVYEDLPYNTRFKDLEFMASWELCLIINPWMKDALAQWGNNSFQTFVLLPADRDMAAVSEKIKMVKADHVDKDDAVFKPEIFLFPMKDWHLHWNWKEGINTGGRIDMVWLFGIIGVFVLLLACINFMNLSTARSEKRAKEVGIRMTIGSVRSQLINQFMSESFLVVLISFVLAVGIVLLSIPAFNELADKRIEIQWMNPLFWLASFAFVLATSLLAGSYPALYLSSFQPVKVLKGTFKMGRFASLPRKILVVLQFTVSVSLIIGTVIVYQQIQFTKDRPIGYQTEGLVTMQMKSQDFYGKLDVLRNELKASGAVEELSESSSPMTEIWSNNGGFDWKGKDPAIQPDFATIFITPEYGKTVSWEIKEGRDLSRDYSTDSAAFILNEAAVKFMGVTNPVGMEMTWNDQTWHVVGVVKDLLTTSPYEPVKQAVYVFGYENVNWINIKLNPSKGAHESLAAIEAVFKKHIPAAPFDYKFVDEEYSRKFEGEERIGKLASVFAVLAIAISCLGLFGLASFVAEQRTKEIGVRKVLGASIANLWRMLSKDFVLLVIISCAIAIPSAWYFLGAWLKNFQYRTEISWVVFAGAGLGAVVITLATVSYQAIRAAKMNPVNSLRSE